MASAGAHPPPFFKANGFLLHISRVTYSCLVKKKSGVGESKLLFPENTLSNFLEGIAKNSTPVKFELTDLV